MYRKEITAEFVVEFLNNLLKIDKDAIMNLVESRVKCNDAMADQATCNLGRMSLGILGLINGFFGVNDKGYGCIVAHYDGDESRLGDLLYFSVKRDW